MVEEQLNGALYITYRAQKLLYHKIMTRPIRVKHPVNKKKNPYSINRPMIILGGNYSGTITKSGHKPRIHKSDISTLG